MKPEKKIEVWPIKLMKVKELVPNEQNPRTISAEKLEKLKNQILSVGFNNPPKIDNDGVLLGGNSRFRVLMAAGEGELEIPVMYPPRKLTKKERQEIIITDNVNDGEWDFDLLANDFEISDLKEWGLEIPEIKIQEEQLEKEILFSYKIEVECINEKNQQELTEELESRGFKIRVLI